MTPDNALRDLREAAAAVAELPVDDDRLPGLAKSLAGAALALDASMMSGSMPLEWAATGQWRWVGKP